MKNMFCDVKGCTELAVYLRRIDNLTFNLCEKHNKRKWIKEEKNKKEKEINENQNLSLADVGLRGAIIGRDLRQKLKEIK